MRRALPWAAEEAREAGEALRQVTHDTVPGTFAPGEVDRALLERLVDKQTLGAVRKRFLAHLINEPPPDEIAVAWATDSEAAAADGGDIDLF